MNARVLCTGILLLLDTGIANAQRERLDDSLSPVDNIQIDLNWGERAIDEALAALALPENRLPDAYGRTPGVEVLLDTRAYTGRRARIYLALPEPAGSIGDIELRWEVSGEFFAGSVRPGQAVLIFEGVIDDAVTGAVFNFELSVADGAGSTQNRMEAIYEIELLP